VKKIITISREFGAGGGEIGRAVAKELGYTFYDKAILLRSARESGIDVDRLLKWDEKIPMDFGFAQSLFDFYNKPLSEKLFEVQQQVIREIAEKGKCVILGRNANTILKEFEHTLHTFVYAPPAWRLERMQQQMPDITKSKISSIDKARRKYSSFHSGTEFGNANAYDICLNTSSIGTSEAIDTLCRLAAEVL
jgi:Cytidylate kinase